MTLELEEQQQHHHVGVVVERKRYFSNNPSPLQDIAFKKRQQLFHDISCMVADKAMSGDLECMEIYESAKRQLTSRYDGSKGRKY